MIKKTNLCDSGIERILKNLNLNPYFAEVENKKLKKEILCTHMKGIFAK